MSEITNIDDTKSDKLILNKDLYSFDKKKELFDDTKKEEKYYDTSLNAFCKFAGRDGTTTLGPCELVDFLPSWGPELKINDIISTSDKKKGQDYRFLLNALDHQRIKKKQQDKNFAKRILQFYTTIFDEESDEKSISSCVGNFTTFVIELRPKATKKTGDIIAAITFFVDDDRNNAFICWLGVMKDFPPKFKKTYLKEVGDSFQKNGIGTLLIIIVIKYCMVKNTSKLDLWLQANNDLTDSILFYQKLGFCYASRSKETIPESITKKLKNYSWIDQDNMIIMKCSHGFFKPKEKKMKIESETEDIIIDLTPTSETYEKVGTINMDKERRKEVYKKILSYKPEFNWKDYANSLKMMDNDHFEDNDGYFSKKGYEKRVYIKYPPNTDTIIKTGAIGMDTMMRLFNDYPLLKEYM